ncbi:hypothetical protein C8Q77DRAFT_1218268 [Trametes polyzona]|nr:hypothetical protein C8Q77DRAFT_1218268 [Trametes polyzona]
MAHTLVSLHQSRPHPALHQQDILEHVFDTLETRAKGLDRQTLAGCTVVCKSWSDPASRVLWRILDSFHPLWALLAGRSFPPSAKRMSEFWKIVEPDIFVKEICSKEPEWWKHFLYRASHVREVGTASVRESELVLIQSVVKHNGGLTFLPTLRRLGWRNGVASDTTLHLIASPSLRDLELDFTAFRQLNVWNQDDLILSGDVADIRPEDLLSGLSTSAPFLRHLAITGRRITTAAVVPHLLGFQHLRCLSLFKEVPLTPEVMQSVLTNLPSLSMLNARIHGFSDPQCKGVSTSMRMLRLHGHSQDFVGLFSSFLDVPHLDILELNLADESYTPSLPHALSALSRTSFTTSLRHLSLSALTRPLDFGPDADADVDPSRPSVLSTTVIAPLSAFRSLEVAELHLLDLPARISDADMRALARAWPRLRRLVLAYSPMDPQHLPSLASLRHFAAHCPELRYMSVSKLRLETMSRDADGEETAADEEKTVGGHPLERLDLRMTLVGRGPFDTQGIARFIDGLFPNLILDGEAKGSNGFAPFVHTWDDIERDIRALRVARAL